MRIKFLPTHSKQSYTVNYLFKKEESSKEETLLTGLFEDQKCQRILSTIDNDTKDSWISITKDYCELRKEKTGFDIDWNKNTMHLVISVHPDDGPKIANVWPEIVAKVHSELGIGSDENNSIAWLHRDVDHHHVHLLFSKMNYRGVKFDDSNIGRRLNDLANQFDLEYDLTKGANQAHKAEPRNPYKKAFTKKLYEASRSSKTFDEYVSNLKSKGIGVTLASTNDSPQIIYTDSQTNIKYFESKLANEFAFRNITQLDRIGEKRAFNYQEQHGFVRDSVSKALNNSNNEGEFEKLLKDKYNITLIKHSNSGGVFGYSFQQNGVESPYTFKASQIGFSYNKIQYYLNNDASKLNRIQSKDEYNANQTTASTGQLLGSATTQVDDDDFTRKKKRKKKDRNI